MRFKSAGVRPIMHSLLFKDRHWVAKVLIKINSAINTCLIRQKIILYYS